MRIVLSVLFTIAIICNTIVTSTPAFAETSVTETILEDGSTETKYYWRADEERPQEQDGSIVKLDTDYVAPTQEYSENIIYRIAIDDIDRLGEVIPQTLSIANGDFKGDVGLDPENPYTIIPIYETQIAQVDRAEVITGLPDNDAVRLPQTHTYTVRSSAMVGATQPIDFALSSAAYELVGTTDQGRPNNWTAYLEYRGVEDFLVLQAYDVTAHYKGLLADSVPRYVMYTTTALAQTQIAEPEMPLAVVLAAAVGISVVLALAALLLWLLVFRKNIKLVKETEANREVVFKKFVNLRNGIAEIKIPTNVEIYSDGSDYALELKPALANKQGSLMVIWNDRIIAHELLSERIELSRIQIVKSLPLDALFSKLNEAGGQYAQ